MNLGRILDGIAREAIPEQLRERPIAGLEYDSRRVERDYLFFAFPGARTDGRLYAQQALARGAAAVVSELPPIDGFAGTWIHVPHGRQALALACRSFYGPPEEWARLYGVTGTNGKTTTAHLVDGLFRSAGYRTALLGTTGNVIAGEPVPAVNTTPESLDLYRLFERLRAAGGTRVSMEVSSHGLALGRVYGLAFAVAVFTNLTRDHLDFHETMEAYFESKQRLFLENGAQAPHAALVNSDDAYGRQLRTHDETRVITYGLGEDACLRATDVAMGFDGLSFQLSYRGRKVAIRSGLAGRVNVYNILAACGVGVVEGMSLDMVASGIATVEAVPGRFERVDEGQPFLVVVDYAHTDDALRNAIAVARSLEPKRVITVFGCGGDRDRTKRPLMGMAAGELSDYVVLTSDNPRSEDPLDIINDALVGLRRFDTPHRIEVDRTEAIRAAIAQAGPGDLVLIAGKGHEPYQIFRDRTIDFDDRATARKILGELGFGGE